jgi:NRPS condensation-like uncharacterized protein
MSPSAWRELNRAESSFWLLSEVSSMNFAVFAKCKGEVSDAALSAVCDQMMDSYPMAQASIDASSGKLVFVRAEGKVAVKRTSGDWTQDFARELIRPFAFPGAFWRVTVHDLERAVFQIAITFHHSVADGRSGFSFMLDFLRRLDQYPAQLETERREFPSDRFAPFLRNAKSPRLTTDSMPWFAKRSQPSSPQMDCFTLEKEETSRLVSRARENKCTVHGWIGAAQILSLSSLFGDDRSHTLALSTPADVRSRLYGGAPDAGLELCISLVTTAIAATEMGKVARELSQHIRSELASDAFLQFYEALPDPVTLLSNPKGLTLFATMMQRGVQASVLSNVGIVSPPVFQKIAVESMSFTVHPMITQPVFVTVTTFEGRMHFVLNHDSNRWESRTFDSFLESFRNSLAG